MEEVLRADIFFFITSVAVVVVTLLVAVSVYYWLKTLRRFRNLIDEADFWSIFIKNLFRSRKK